jgi:glyoxylase-like metal-dependent hydrolase (beta-lactamase superfamily II)
MNIHTIVVGDFQVNCYILSQEEGKAIIVDPGDDAARIAAMLREKDLTPIAYLMTHGHVDHITALKQIASEFPAPIALHGDDAEWAFGEESKIMPFLEIPARPEEIAIDLKQCREIPDLGTPCEVIHTPGHTPGSVCFYFPRCSVLITGDTLFAGSVGRTDLPGGSARTLAESLNKLKELPDDTQIFPGHGPASTIGSEKRTNYFMQMP